MNYDFNKIELGFSELTGRVYVFIPNSDGSAKVKKDVTDSFNHICKLIESRGIVVLDNNIESLESFLQKHGFLVTLSLTKNPTYKSLID